MTNLSKWLRRKFNYLTHAELVAGLTLHGWHSPCIDAADSYCIFDGRTQVFIGDSLLWNRVSHIDWDLSYSIVGYYPIEWCKIPRYKLARLYRYVTRERCYAE